MGSWFAGRTSSAAAREAGQPSAAFWRSAARLLWWAMPALLAPAFAFAQPPAAPSASANPPLRVCADPNDLPFSNRAEQGFENKLAQMLGQSLGRQVQFVWKMQGNGFLRSVAARKCDVVMGLPTDDHAYGVLTTDPYYRSAYALVYRANAPYRLKSLDDPRLRTLQIGVHSMFGDKVYLPPGTILAHRGIVNNVHGYDLFADYYRHANPSANLIKAVADGDVDVAIAWGPLAGYFATREPVKLTVVPLAHTHTKLPFQYTISMAVSHGDTALRDKLNAFLAAHRAKIHELLANYGVPQLDLSQSGAAQLQARAGRAEAQD
jgi:mxaJ protein